MEKQRRRADTSHDQRRDVKLMRRLGYTHAQIEAELGLSTEQVRYAISHPAGRPTTLAPEQVAQLEAFVTASGENGSLAYDKIPGAMGWGGPMVGADVVRRVLRRLGYRRERGRKNTWKLERRVSPARTSSTSAASASSSSAVAIPREPTSTRDPTNTGTGSDTRAAPQAPRTPQDPPSLEPSPEESVRKEQT